MRRVLTEDVRKRTFPKARAPKLGAVFCPLVWFLQVQSPPPVSHQQKKVMIVSPTTFLAYLQTVLQGLKALQIEESAKEIRKRVEELGRHLGSYETYMKKLGTHLGTSTDMYNRAYKELGKIDKDILRITGKAVEIEPIELEAPRVEEDEEIE